jgi:tRNA(fMet)-specific endonuclease VapC
MQIWLRRRARSRPDKADCADVCQANGLLGSKAQITLMKDRPSFLARLRRQLPDDFGAPAVGVQEFLFAADKRQHQAKSPARAEALRFEVLGFDRGGACRVGQLRDTLAGRGIPIGPGDLLIAKQALLRSLTLVTGNAHGLQRVTGL